MTDRLNGMSVEKCGEKNERVRASVWQGRTNFSKLVHFLTGTFFPFFFSLRRRRRTGPRLRETRDGETPRQNGPGFFLRSQFPPTLPTNEVANRQTDESPPAATRLR